MAINLKKNESYYDGYDQYDDLQKNKNPAKFSNIDITSLLNGKRTFVPYSFLKSEHQEDYIEELLDYLNEKTNKYYSCFYVNEEEPYEVNGFYIQLSPELIDVKGRYVKNGNYVYDTDGKKWHVSYYYENNLLRILIDNSFKYKVVQNLSEFSLDFDFGKSDNCENNENDFLKKRQEELNECDGNETTSYTFTGYGQLLSALFIAFLGLLFVIKADSMSGFAEKAFSSILDNEEKIHELCESLRVLLHFEGCVLVVSGLLSFIIKTIKRMLCF